MKCTEARTMAKRILAETDFTRVKPIKFFGKWQINISGGRAFCYGITVETVEGAENLIRIHAKEEASLA